ncbi:hypothetical protein ACWD3J_13650 [Streptomyces sp. NPDC002755]
MSIAIRFEGGPADGRTLAIRDDYPPPLYLIPQPPSVADLFSAAPLEAALQAAEYEPLWESGLPRRADDGVYLYVYRTPPVTPEQRKALEHARRKAKAREDALTAERDAAWQEIRQERPGYPADWRDLF